MKRIYYLLAFVAVATAFTACNPLDKTYKELGDLPAPSGTATTAVTLSAADYGLLPKGHAAKTALYFKSVDTAKVDVPLILNSKYPTYGEKSIATVTYNITPTTVKLADSVFANVSYTVVNPTDYVAAQAITGTTFKDYSAAQVLLFLNYKYPAPVANQLVLLTYLYFESGVTPTAGVLTTDSFIYLNGTWTKGYTITPAQYAAVGRSNFGNFTTSDAPNLPSIFNGLLKADLNVSATAKVGDIKYVSFKYFVAASGSIPAVTSQRILPLTYDGTNWVSTPTPITLAFAKTNGTWVADNTVTYQLTPADHVTISGLTFGSAEARANLASFKSVDLRTSSTTKWTSDEIANAVAAFAKIKYGATAEQNQIFNLTYYGYTGTYAYVLVKLKYVGTEFVIQK